MISITPTESNIFKSVGDFVTTYVPGLPIVIGQENRVPPPKGTDYAVMWLLNDSRIATNASDLIDAVFTGSITGSLLTITAIDSNFAGRIIVGTTIFGVGVADNTFVQSFGTGTGGIGTYNLTNSQTVSSRVIAAGRQSLVQAAEVVVQLDIHGPNSTDNKTVISTVLRDERGVDTFDSFGFELEPLYCDDPRQMPFINDSQQYENRWTLDLHLQANFTVTLGQQFAAALAAGLVNVDERYPP